MEKKAYYGFICETDILHVICSCDILRLGKIVRIRLTLQKSEKIAVEIFE